MKAIIMAAGKGTRLYPYSKLVPKPLMPIDISDQGFITIIEHLILLIKKSGINEFAIVLNYKKEQIMDYLETGKRLGVKIKYYIQEVLDGNAGAIYCCKDFLDSDMLVTDCDNYIFDENNFIGLSESFTGYDISVGVSEVEDYSKYAIIKQKKGKPIDIVEKPLNNKFGNLAKSGFMIISKKILSLGKEISKVNDQYTTTQIIKYAIDNNLKINLYNSKFSDMGTWKEYNTILASNFSK